MPSFFNGMIKLSRSIRICGAVHFEQKLSIAEKAMYTPPYRGTFRRSTSTGSSFRSPYMTSRSVIQPPMLPPYGTNPYSTLAGEQSVRIVKCGELRRNDFGQEVEIAGRVQNMRMNRFLFLRDDTGITQLVAPDERVDLQKKMSTMPLDSYVRVRGEVLLRPETSRNDSMATGSIEVLIHEFITVQIKRKQNFNEEEEGGAKRKKAKPGGKKMTTEEVAKAETAEMRSYFAARSLTCGDLTSDMVNAGDEISLCGWVLTKRPPLFLVLKDGHGEVQLVPSFRKPEMTKQFKQVRPGDVVFVKGILARRPFGQGNSRVPNGLMEVAVVELTIVDKNSPHCNENQTSNEGNDPAVEAEECEAPPAAAGEVSPALVNRYTRRTHTCGELRADDVGKTVSLMGWLEFVRLTKFLTLRDGYGTTQILISENDVENNQLLNNLSLESILEVTGTVCCRPTAQIKQEHPTGEIEVLASKITILNEAKKNLPFSIRDFKKAREPLRMQHRYLDLRFKEIQNNLRIRSKVVMKMREFLIHHLGFVEVETPTLFKATPGGAREFVVPTHQSGMFYSLVQSPQQLKQLLMVGAMDRYFQVARCYRDESTRPDRQPEFTQLDIELSFCDQEDVMNLVEDLLKNSWEVEPKIVAPFPRLTYAEAMETYGTDKPDLRYDWKIVNITDEFHNGAVDDSKVNIKERIAAEDFSAYAIVAEKGNVVYSSTVKKTMEEKLKLEYLLTPFILSGKSVRDRLQILFGADIGIQVAEKTAVKDDSVLFLAIGHKHRVLESVGKFRVSWADLMEEKGFTVRNKNLFKFLWVTEFPLFSTGDNGKLESNHHPFTAPKPNDEPLLFINPMKVNGLHYDLVLNGNEVGGGSIRIHNGDLQERVLKDLLHLPTDSLSHLLAALRSGAPPHGGIALGIDRLIAIMVGANSIRDVIAFPKSVDGKDPLTGAPGPLTDDEIKYYHLLRPERAGSSGN